MKAFLFLFPFGFAVWVWLFASMVSASGYTEPRIEPKPGHSGPPLILRCENDPGRTFKHEHQRDAECRNHETEPPEVECSMMRVPGRYANGKPEKECA